MDPLPATGLALAAGYLLGSVPFAWVAVKARTGQDLRKSGSGNIGATNAARVLGKPWFVPLFLLDAAKGIGAVLLAASFGEGDGARVAGASGAILGHLFSPWLGFRGGKAVATGAGALAILTPLAVAGGFVGFGLVAAIWRYVSLGSVGAAIAVCTTHFLFARRSPPVDVFVCVLAVVVVAKHVSNFRRIAAGTEPRIGGSP